MLPHDGAGGCWPSPRNDRLASAMIAAATVRLDWMSSGGSMLGRTWPHGDAQPRAAERPRGDDELLGGERQRRPARQPQERRAGPRSDGEHRR